MKEFGKTNEAIMGRISEGITEAIHEESPGEITEENTGRKPRNHVKKSEKIPEKIQEICS